VDKTKLQVNLEFAYNLLTFKDVLSMQLKINALLVILATYFLQIDVILIKHILDLKPKSLAALRIIYKQDV